MKKISLICVVLCLCLFGCVSNANSQTAISTSRFLDNTYIGVSGSVLTTLQFDPFLPVEGDVSVKVGKWLTPAFGLNVEERLGFGTSSLWMYYFTKSVVRTNNIMLNMDVDLFQAIRFKPERKFTIIVEAGIGWLHEYGDSDNSNDISMKNGVILGWNLGKQRAWQFYVEPEIIWNLTNYWGTNNESKHVLDKNNGQVGIEVGFNYRFKNKKKSGGTHNFVLYDISDYKNEIAVLVDDNQKLKDIIDSLPKEVHDTIYITINNDYDVRNVVLFSKASSELVDTSILDAIPTGKSVRVYGYASPEGSERFNQELSQKRAEVVADYLESKGVNVISVEGKGVAGSNSNRLAIAVVDENTNATDD